MTDLNLFAELETIDVTELIDLNNTQSGGGRGLLPKGTAFIRPVFYVEYGVQKQRDYDGKTKDPVPEFEIGFAIVGGSGLNAENKPERYVLEEGKYPIIKSYPKPISLYDKSQCVGIHKALNRVGSKCSHMVQKLIESPLYQVTITHEVPDKGKNAGKTIHKIDFRNLQPAWDSVNACEYTMPEVDKSIIQAFLWDKPSIGQWDSLYIDGMNEAVKNEKGEITKPASSKNFIQEKILSALNFEGSPIQKLLAAAGKEIAAPIASLEAGTTAEKTTVAAPVDTPVQDNSVVAVPDLD